MRRKFSIKLSWIVVFTITIIGCKHSRVKHEHEHKLTFTCPMHPEIKNDKPGLCAICNMELVAIKNNVSAITDTSNADLLAINSKQYAGNLATIEAAYGTRIFSVPLQGAVAYDSRKKASIASRISGRVERLYVKYNYQPVQKGQLIMEVYSPELAVAQRDLLLIRNADNDPSLITKAKNKLLFLGMSIKQIDRLLATGKVNYNVPIYSTVSGFIVERKAATNRLPQNQEQVNDENSMFAMPTAMENEKTETVNNTAIQLSEGQYVNAGQTMFNVYSNSGLVAEFRIDASIMGHLKKGSRLLYYPVGNKQAAKAGAIKLIEPVQQPGSSFTIARVYIDKQSMYVGQLLHAQIPIVAKGWWLPESAVYRLGTTAVIFKKLNETFVPKRVTTGLRAEGLIQIIDTIENWQIAKNAGFVLGSENFIKINENP